jgi:hypothetical protein
MQTWILLKLGPSSIPKRLCHEITEVLPAVSRGVGPFPVPSIIRGTPPLHTDAVHSLVHRTIDPQDPCNAILKKEGEKKREKTVERNS